MLGLLHGPTAHDVCEVESMLVSPVWSVTLGLEGQLRGERSGRKAAFANAGGAKAPEVLFRAPLARGAYRLGMTSQPSPGTPSPLLARPCLYGRSARYRQSSHRAVCPHRLLLALPPTKHYLLWPSCLHAATSWFLEPIMMSAYRRPCIRTAVHQNQYRGDVLATALPPRRVRAVPARTRACWVRVRPGWYEWTRCERTSAPLPHHSHPPRVRPGRYERTGYVD